jgi:3-oxocholest-4-en-26-oyl-CoA dehydrogenase alpha subunit
VDGGGVHLALTPEQEQFQAEARAYFEGLMTDEVRAELGKGELEGPTYRNLVKQLGTDGWLTVAWPKEYGGRGLSPIEAFIFFDESQRAGVPIPFLTTNTVGPTLMRFGSEEQRQRFLPGIAAGDIHFSIGYSEPDAGTDLASLKTRAVRDGDHWVINGQKMWTSLIHHADYVWLACRTDPDAKKHKGISMIIVPTDSEGFGWTPVNTLGGGFTSATYYEDVRVPVDNLVGEENGGWQLITTQLNEERVALSSSGTIQRKLDEVRAWAQETKLPDGRRVIDQEWVQLNLAKVRAKTEYLRLLNHKLAWGATQGATDPSVASSVKVFGSEFYIEAYQLLMEILGANSLVRKGSPGALLEAGLERAMRSTLVLTFGGGTNEIQRDIISWIGLGMPRPTR